MLCLLRRLSYNLLHTFKERTLATAIVVVILHFCSPNSAPHPSLHPLSLLRQFTLQCDTSTRHPPIHLLPPTSIPHCDTSINANQDKNLQLHKQEDSSVERGLVSLRTGILWHWADQIFDFAASVATHLSLPILLWTPTESTCAVLPPPYHPYSAVLLSAPPPVHF